MEALIRYGPEESGLRELERQAQQTYESSVGAARGTAESIIGAVGQARPEVTEVYDDAQSRQAGLNAALAGDAAALGGVAGAAIDAEQRAASSRIGESRASALTDLSQRKVAAQEGRAFAVKQARSQLIDDLTKVLQRKQDLAGEKGAFMAATVGDLREAAADRAARLQIEELGNSQSERNSLRSAGIDPETGAAIPGGKLDPDADGKRGEKGKGKGRGGGGDPLTDGQRAAAADTVAQALNWGGKLKRAGLGFNEAVKALSEGREAKPVFEEVDDGRGGTKRQKVLNRDGTEKMTPALPKIESNLLLRAALEEAYLGHVTRQTQRRVRSRGLGVRELALTPYQRRVWSPPPTSRPDAAQR
jgi:hypothetical protein